MNVWVTLLFSILYLGSLFGVAFWSERAAAKGKSWVSNPYVYALSLAVYCTAWTFYGSVGRAATSGVGFLPVYLGPTLTAPLWVIILRKIVIISKAQRITSIADFLSSRYGKSTQLGVIATMVAVFGIIPYISIQLKAISVSFETLTGSHIVVGWGGNYFLDASHLITFFLALFTILFGARHIDATERHEGLVSAIAFESFVKLITFLAVGIFVTYFVYDGFDAIFEKALRAENIARLMTLEGSGLNGWEWGWLMIISMLSIFLLPRQFHVAVVENTASNHVSKAMWLFPLYLLLINIFVLPIAFGGLMHFPNSSNDAADMFVLNLPLAYNQKILALIVFIGGLSAATSMVIVATISLSIMVSNNLFLPTLLKISPYSEEDLDEQLSVGRVLFLRRFSILLVLFLAFLYFRFISERYTLVSIGLISFAAVSQFAPALIGGIFWKRGNQKGATVGLMVGFLIWAYTLAFPTLFETGLLPKHLIEGGLFGISWLHPYQFLGMEGVSQISQSAFWSLFFNTFFYVCVSLFTTPSPMEHRQANLFVDIYKYAHEVPAREVFKRSASFYDIQLLLNRFLGGKRTESMLQNYAITHHLQIDKIRTADADLINYAENVLAGTIGAASSRILIESIVKEDPISLEEVMDLLGQTQEIMQYSKELEKKSKELETATLELQAANDRLKELDHLKDDFITTVTHELRTPITSIKALARLMYDAQKMPTEKRQEFLEIIVNESERLTRLINQVLDLEKIQIKQDDWKTETVHFNRITRQAVLKIYPLIQEQNIELTESFPDEPLYCVGDTDRLTQVLLNLLSNAVKFCNPDKGHIHVALQRLDHQILLKVTDNGKGISPENQQLIFDRFTQINDQRLGKPKGSGLGLFISKTIIEHHHGCLEVESKLGNGATFIVRLPAKVSPLQKNSNPQQD